MIKHCLDNHCCSTMTLTRKYSTEMTAQLIEYLVVIRDYVYLEPYKF